MSPWLREHRFALGSALTTVRKAPGSFLFNVVVVAVALALPFAGITLLDNVRPMSEQLSVDPEVALRDANSKFGKRFRAMEALAQTRGQDFASLSLDEQEALWVAVKKIERSSPGAAG